MSNETFPFDAAFEAAGMAAEPPITVQVTVPKDSVEREWIDKLLGPDSWVWRGRQWRIWGWVVGLDDATYVIATAEPTWKNPADLPLVETIENAFRPLECRAHTVDFGTTFRLYIRDAEGHLVTMVGEESQVSTGHIRARQELKDFLTGLRRSVQEEHHVQLDPWEFPADYQG